MYLVRTKRNSFILNYIHRLNKRVICFKGDTSKTALISLKNLESLSYKVYFLPAHLHLCTPNLSICHLVTQYYSDSTEFV